MTMKAQDRSAIILHGLLSTVPLCIQGQNLIPNPSFEDYTGSCTFGIDYSAQVAWGQPDCSIPSLCFNSCSNANAPYAGVPRNDWAYEYAHTGEGYCAFTTFSQNASEGNPRVYMSVDLSEPLTAGTEYCIRFWLSLADSSSHTTSALYAFLWYGLPSICNSNDTAWDNNAAVTFNTASVDTSGWQLIEGSFTASGGESNLTIGSFLFDQEIDTTLLVEHGLNNYALYLVDDVYLGSCDVGVMEAPNTLDQLGLWPNPASSILNVRVPKQIESGTLEVTDAIGRVLQTHPVESLEVGVNVSALSNGAYHVRLVGDQEMLVAVFMVEHQ